jgi:hydroxymethylbilane synthase
VSAEVFPITTSGDQTQHSDAPGTGWGSGVFVKELEAALLRGDIDLAVHSLKDVPTEVPDQLAIMAIPQRADPRDVLVSTQGWRLDELPRGAVVGTTSARRVALLRAVRSDLHFAPIRGNIGTRCRKLLSGKYDAIVLAHAGLSRLGLQVHYTLLDPRVLLPAPGQGALALQGRRTDVELAVLLMPLHDPLTAASVEAERAFMAAVDGGCRMPLAALATPEPRNRLKLVAAIASPDGARVINATDYGAVSDPVELGLRLAARLRALGADHLLASSSELRV